ncbi:hypothetical protein [Candidatus Tisiphia endosymbiont of Oplodontha viridula]|uniref:hypothetical protein n=1 Tax=Candidatus Tisiphia endosymbiont of Oplodontha viridula TaxID=3077925 RepID=UPI0035C89350
MIQYFNSGLYIFPFYTTHKLDFSVTNSEDIEYNRELLAEYYALDRDLKYQDENDKWEQVDEMLWQDLESGGYTYFEPKVFDERIALECFLTPFRYKERPMLSLEPGNMDLSARLDAYQVLAHNTIDQHSKFFGSKCEKYFLSAYLGESVTKKLMQVLSM